MHTNETIERIMEKDVMYAILSTATDGGFYKTIRPKNDIEEDIINSLVDMGFSVEVIKKGAEKNKLYRIEWCNRIETFKPASALMLSITIISMIDRITFCRSIGRDYKYLIKQLPKVVKTILCKCVDVEDIYSVFDAKTISKITIAELFHTICNLKN